MTKILPITSERDAAAIVAVAEQRLRQSPYFFLKRLECRYESGTLTLRGCVPYHQLRAFAEAIVSRVEGVQHVANQVEVHDPLRGPTAVRAARSAG